MVNPTATSTLSGLTVASRRVQTAADNITNILTVGKPNSNDPTAQAYRAQQVQQSTVAGGGVQARVSEKIPATQTAFDPDSPLADNSGFVEAPNVDLGEELVNLIAAKTAYHASSTVLRTQEELERETFDIVT